MDSASVLRKKPDLLGLPIFRHQNQHRVEYTRVNQTQTQLSTKFDGYIQKVNKCINILSCILGVLLETGHRLVKGFTRHLYIPFGTALNRSLTHTQD